MELLKPIKERDITDYDFMFISGAKLAITIDEQAGDTVKEHADRFTLDIVAKPSLTDATEFSEAEVMQVYKIGLAAVVTCKRKQRMPTEEEMFDMQATVHKLAKQIQ